ncbi:hypothetical protein JOB18_039442 [Solea senegalensis]|uniref:Reverse transcriptase domain-containing protein n=1 Tax=Solea senegalensis TaxID=28829 RepID=A0AAV6SAT0_SOLSE|nr:hypothetical protein JOB18_039442 [Solea senegalensis]
MAAAMVGAVAPFDNSSQTWEEYCEVLDHFFVANDIKEVERKRAVLLVVDSLSYWGAALFQRTMEGVLQGMENVAVYLDDIILTGKDDKDHLQTLDQVLQLLQNAGLCLKRSRWQFMETDILGTQSGQDRVASTASQGESSAECSPTYISD